MKAKKIIVSAFLIMAIAITVATPILARSNIILIRDTYYYTENGTYITSECATSAGEAEHHYAIARAISHVYGTTTNYGPVEPFSSYITATQYIGNHSDDYHNSYGLK